MPEVRQLIVDQIPHLRRYARVLVGDRDRADDLVQDCLERAWSRMHLWRAGTNIRAWLFTILHNLHVNAARRRASQPQPLDTRATDVPVAPTQEDDLNVRDLWQAFARLPEPQRAAIMLISVEEMSYEEAASVLDIPVGTLMSRLHRGRERLRELMADAGDNPGHGDHRNRSERER
jgi:RNA polymerase sigma-70 factor (ECF subfamily)